MAKGDGLIVMKPTSIVVTGAGSSASINAAGGVDFTSAATLSLNGVFTSGFDNYLLIVEGSSGGTPGRVDARLRASGTDASGSNYNIQRLYVQGTVLTGERSTAQTALSIGWLNSTRQSGFVVHVYGPYLAQSTAMRNVGVDAYNWGEMIDQASTHSLSTSYDGITIGISSTVTGSIVVMGYEE